MHAVPSSPRPALVRGLLVLLVLGFAGLRWRALDADLPLDTIQAARFTDEGIYARNAFFLVRTGDWHIEAGYNTAVNYPLVTLLQIPFFRVFGPGLESARAVTLCCVMLIGLFLFLIVRRDFGATAAWLALLVLATNYPYFGISRLGHLDMPMAMLVLASLWIAGRRGAGGLALTVASGVLMTLALLAKSSAICAVPLPALFLWHTSDTRRRAVLRALAYGATVVLLFGAYLAAVRTWYWEDSQAVAASVMSDRFRTDLASLTSQLGHAIAGTFEHTDPVLMALALAGTAILWTTSREWRRQPLPLALWLWVVFQFLSLSVLKYQPPRYFGVGVISMAGLTGALLAFLFGGLRRRVAGGAVAIVVLCVAWQGYRCVEHMTHLQYSVRAMARSVREHIQQDGQDPDRVIVIGHSGATVTLAARILNVGEWFGTGGSGAKLDAHKPAYYIKYEDKSKVRETLRELRRRDLELEHVQSYEVMDNRNGLLEFFRIVPEK